MYNYHISSYIFHIKGKGKAGPVGSRRLRLPDVKTIGIKRW
jgi:hypothetical protein